MASVDQESTKLAWVVADESLMLPPKRVTAIRPVLREAKLIVSSVPRRLQRAMCRYVITLVGLRTSPSRHC